MEYWMDIVEAGKRYAQSMGCRRIIAPYWLHIERHSFAMAKPSLATAEFLSKS
jgi:hypothetical protein